MIKLAMVVGIEIIHELIHMELASLILIFLLPLLGIQRPVVVTKKNGSHNPGGPVSYLLQINYIYILYFMIMK